MLVVLPVDGEDEAVAVANATRYGLAAGVWTADAGRAHRLARRLEAGMVWVNTYGEFDYGTSYGGYGQSGFGRELGPIRSTSTRGRSRSSWPSDRPEPPTPPAPGHGRTGGIHRHGAHHRRQKVLGRAGPGRAVPKRSRPRPAR